MRQLEKCINMPKGIGILVSTLLGSSIFIIPAIVATIAGIHSLHAWIITILLMIPVAFTFSNLGILYPNAGGTAFFVKKAFGNRWGHFTSWLYLSVMPLGPPVVIITGASYLGALLNTNDQQNFMLCTIMLASMFIINLLGLKFVGIIQTVISIVIVTILTLIIILSFLHHPNMLQNINMTIHLSNLYALNQAIPIVFWCFVGLETIVHLAAEFKNVQKDFPKTIIISMFLVGIICFSLGLIVLNFGVYGSEKINSNYLVPLIRNLIGDKSTIVISILGFFTCFATINIYILSFSRMLLSMSNEHIISSYFAKLNENAIPINSLILCYSFVYFTIFLKYMFNIELKNLILYANSVFVFLYFLAGTSGYVLLSGLKKFLAFIATVFSIYIYFSLGIAAIYAFLILIFSIVWDICLSYIRKDTYSS